MSDGIRPRQLFTSGSLGVGLLPHVGGVPCFSQQQQIMPSDTPKDGRCAAKVVSKIGLEVHDHVRDQVFVDDEVRDDDVPTESAVVGEGQNYEPLTTEYDETMVRIVLSDGEHETEVDPEYDDVLPMLREDWNTVAVVVECETEDGIDHERWEIPDDDPYVTNRGTDLDGYCLRYPMDNGRCYVHQGSLEEGNTEGMKHGLYTERSTFYNWLDEEDQRFVHSWVDSWLEDAPFGRDHTAKTNMLYRLAIDQLRLWLSQDETIEIDDEPGTTDGEYSGLVYEQIIGLDDDDEPIETIEESPINLPYSRLSRDTIKGLKELGVLDDPESEQADATQSLAQALSGE